MNRIAFACLATASLLAAAPAHAVTNDNGDILITQAAVNAGGITPGDTAGFPVTISVPGTYRLAANLAVTTAVNGIEVRANEVTIEMGGHTLAGSGIGRNGVTSFNRAAHVSNGTIRGFTKDGVRSVAQFLLVTQMLLTANGRHGVYAEADSSTDAASFAKISDNVVTVNGGTGIACASSCRVENNTVSNNYENGISFLGGGGMALGNTSAFNGLRGIYFSLKGAAGNNALLSNGYDGIAGPYIPIQPNACDPACYTP